VEHSPVTFEAFDEERSVVPVLPPKRWQDRAECRGMPPSLWYPQNKDGSGKEVAMATCSRCPVKAECRQHAIDTGETNGIWGGVNLDPSRAKEPKRE